jgi:hypothetical protein
MVWNGLMAGPPFFSFQVLYDEEEGRSGHRQVMCRYQAW